MERKPHSTGSIVGAVMLFVVGLLAIYVGGYFALGKYRYYPSENLVFREYCYDWLACGYWPAARVEDAATGIVVRLIGPNEYYETRRPHGIVG